MSVLDALRRETRALHGCVERLVPLLTPAAGLPEYVWYLEKMLGFQRPLEPQFARFPELQRLDLEARRKCVLLERDLKALGRGGERLERLPVCAAPVLRELSAALGAMYVVEGATLGGQVLLRHLRVQQPELAACAARGLTGYGGATGERWRAFVEVLEDVGRGMEERVACAGRDTFARLLQWLADAPVPVEVGERRGQSAPPS
jgi:heme oxygenase